MIIYVNSLSRPLTDNDRAAITAAIGITGEEEHRLDYVTVVPGYDPDFDLRVEPYLYVSKKVQQLAGGREAKEWVVALTMGTATRLSGVLDK